MTITEACARPSATRELTITADHGPTHSEISGTHNPIHDDESFAARSSAGSSSATRSRLADFCSLLGRG